MGSEPIGLGDPVWEYQQRIKQLEDEVRRLEVNEASLLTVSGQAHVVGKLKDEVARLQLHAEGLIMGQLKIQDISRKLEAEVSRLREALGKYGKHQDSCYRKGAVEVSSKLEDYPCDCGLDQALGGGG